jgi:REP element-mobilizing transposase RayT
MSSNKFKALSQINGVKIAWLYVDSAADLHSIEAEFIQSLKPPLNDMGNPERTSKTRRRKEAELEEVHTEEWYSHNHVKFLLNYHFVFIPKRRRKVLTANIAKRCREIFQALATEKGWNILALEVAPDHIHLFVGVKPTDAPHLLNSLFSISFLLLFSLTEFATSPRTQLGFTTVSRSQKSTPRSSLAVRSTVYQLLLPQNLQACDAVAPGFALHAVQTCL